MSEIASRPEERGLFAPGDGGGRRRRASENSESTDQGFIGFRKRRCVENEAGRSRQKRKAGET